MKLNASKTETMRVSRSRTMHPPSSLTIDGTVLKESDDLVILGVTFDSKMTFEKYLSSVSRAAYQRFGILRKSWRAFHDRSLLGRCFRGFVLPVLEYCSAVWCSAAIHTLNYWTEQSVVPGFYQEVYLSVTFLIVNPWQSCVCFIRSGPLKDQHLLMVLYLDRMCQCGLHAVLWSHTGTLIHRLAAEPCSTAGLLFPSRCPSGTILLTPFFKSMANASYWPKLLYPYYSILLFFPFYSFCLQHGIVGLGSSD